MTELEPYTEYERIYKSINSSKIIQVPAIYRWIDLFEKRYGVPEMAMLLHRILKNKFSN